MGINMVCNSKEYVFFYKPSGLPTSFRNKDDLTSNNLCRLVFNKYPILKKVAGYKSYEGGLLYRLDNDTAGIVGFAWSSKAFNKFTNSTSYKFYIGITDKTPNWQRLSVSDKVASNMTLGVHLRNGKVLCEYIDYNWLNNFGISNFDINKGGAKFYRVNVPIGHSKKSKKKMVLVEKGMHRPLPAISWFRLIGMFGRFYILEIVIKKGFRHQIRVHAKYLGCSLLGDSLYGGSKAGVLGLYCYKVGAMFYRNKC